MIKINLTIVSMLILCCGGTIVKSPTFQNKITLLDQYQRYQNVQQLLWQTHAMDFLRLVDLEKVLSTAIRFIDDPEVMRFIGFLLSPKFQDMVWELESLEEFKEAYVFLRNRGYDVQSLIDYINAGLSLPQFTNPKMILRYNPGVSGFLAAMIGTLPLEDIEKLWKQKLENDTEVAEFFDVIKSSEFMDIIKRMFSSSKFAEFKLVFESYGVDFSVVCEIIQEIAGVEYHNFFCEDNQVQLFM